MRGATITCLIITLCFIISTHTPLARRDLLLQAKKIMILDFYSHASCEARHGKQKGYKTSGNFYSHASCEARPYTRKARPHNVHFYSHAPCGARRSSNEANERTEKFLLTRPMRGATSRRVPGGHRKIYFYSHAPCGARLEVLRLGATGVYFYSHAPCGARHQIIWISICTIRFLLTRPMRGATRTPFNSIMVTNISTHTPHAGRDPPELG